MLEEEPDDDECEYDEEGTESFGPKSSAIVDDEDEKEDCFE